MSLHVVCNRIKCTRTYVGKIGNQLSKCSLDQIGRHVRKLRCLTLYYLLRADEPVTSDQPCLCLAFDYYMYTCILVQAHVQYVHMNLSNMINTIYAEHAIYRDLLTS